MNVTEFSIDSRDRDCNKYPNPNMYSLELPTTYKNVYSIEVMKTFIPQSQYVVDNHNNKIHYQYENNDLNCVSIIPCQDKIVELVYNINAELNPVYISMTVNKNKITIHNNYSESVTLFFSHRYSIGHVIGFSSDLVLEPGTSRTSDNPIIFQNEPSVFMNINGYSHIDNMDNISVLYKHIFNKQNEQKHKKEFTPPIGKLFKVDISFHNYNNTLYNFHGYNHTFNLRLKYE